MTLDRVVDRMVDMMLAREREGRQYGTIVVAEGMAEYLPTKYLEGVSRDDHGHINISSLNLSTMMSKLVSERYNERTGKTRKVNGLQLGYEARCAPPQAYDVMLGSQLGVGAYRALVEEKLNGVMVSVSICTSSRSANWSTRKRWSPKCDLLSKIAISIVWHVSWKPVSITNQARQPIGCVPSVGCD